jgi:hypothetical protein
MMDTRILLLRHGVPLNEPWLEACAEHLKAACAGSGRMKYVMKSVVNRAFAPRVFSACLELYEKRMLPKPPVFSALTWAFRVAQESLIAHLGGVERTVACFRELGEASIIQKPVLLWRGVTTTDPAHAMVWRAGVGVAAFDALKHSNGQPWHVVRTEVSAEAILHYEEKIDVRVTVDPALLGAVFLEDYGTMGTPAIQAEELPVVPQALMKRWLESARLWKLKNEVIASLTRFR